MPEINLNHLVTAVHGAGEIALKYFRNNPKTWEKGGDQGQVSEADLEVDQYLEDFFHQIEPSLAILSEETEDSPGRLGQDRLLIVDPIDGTRAFLNNEPYFAISLALVQSGRPIASVVFAPALDDLFTAQIGLGCFRNDQAVEGTLNRLDHPRILASRAKYNQPIIKSHPKFKIDFRPSIAYRLALVAAGEFDGTFSLRPCWDWDLAGGDLLCAEAGLDVVDLTGNPPIYNGKFPQQNGMIAGGSDLVNNILNTLKEL